ncbi:PDDEXK family nuclease [Levilactobacillus brevis]|uniref:hypothetical protein n=1 Tax=Levilactobacillus brevis TaxID=1580 RepID=UPI00111B994C|nr:hypothetical protein [Levilactobacillus brevis]QCZ42415.1 transporter [Levilactobacillus brevis]
MQIFKHKFDKESKKEILTSVDQILFENEKKLQTCIEDNLELTIGVEFIATEFTVGKYRLDTVGYDVEVGSFVIIEYKKTTKYSVVDQGYAYLNTLLNHKADFVLAYNERYGESKIIKDFDWSQVRLIFIAQSFDDYQKDAAANPNLPIELYEAKLFDNHELILNRMIKENSNQKTANNVTKVTFNVSQNETTDITNVKDIHPVSENEHLIGSAENVQKLYSG